VVVNEVTTVASVTALQQFMSITPGGSPAWTIGAPAARSCYEVHASCLNMLAIMRQAKAT
jgi:hypothetical protein